MKRVRKRITQVENEERRRKAGIEKWVGKPKYKEANPSIFCASIKGDRIHDFLKGFGAIQEDGSIIWDSFVPSPIPPTPLMADGIMLLSLLGPMITKIMPDVSLEDIVDAQPMHLF